jgi:hypothetical protein
MNKKQLAKLLIKHPEIKALYESQEFDASIINKIVAEEIMREDEDEEGEGRVSKADKQARATLDAVEDSELRPVNCKKDDISCLKQEIAAAKTEAELKELAKDVEDLDPGHQGLLNALEAAKARIEGSGSEAPPAEEEDPVKKELIQSMKSEIEFLKSLLSDPNEMPLDKEEYEQAIDEYIEKLEEMGVEVAKTDSIEDDKAFVKSVADSKPEIEKEANAVKAAEEDDFAEKFSDLDAAIMAALKGSKDAATAANDELDLSDIEIEDDGSDNPAGSGLKIDNSSSSEVTRDDYDDQIIGMKDAIPEEDKKQFIKNLKSKSPNPTIERILGSFKSYLEMFDNQQHVENILKVFEPDQQMELPADNEQPATEEGTAAAIEAIVDKVPAEVEDIEPADVEEAEEELETEIEASPEKQVNAEELKTKVEKKKMGTDDKRSLSNKIHRLKNENRFDEIAKIIEILGKANSTLDELQSVWPTAKGSRLQGYKAALSNLPEGVRTAITKANEIMNSNPESEEAQQVVTAAAAEVEKAITTFEEKIEKFRNTSAEKLAAKSGKQAGDYTSMKVMQNPYFAMFLAQQLAKANLSESILREEANFDTDLLQKAINDNKEEVGIIATDSGLDLATAIKEKFGIDIQAQPKDTSMKDVANEIKPKYEEKMGSEKGLKKFLNDLFVSNKNEDGTFDLEAVKAEADRQLNLDNADGQDSGEDSGIESGEADEIIATTLQSLNSNVEAFPELLANDQFKSLLAMTLRNSNSDSSQSSDNTADSDEELVDADSNSTMQESLSGIYLTEEDPAPPIQSDEEENLPPKTQSDEETGSTMSTDEASGLFNEIQEMQKLFDGQENLKTINVMDLAKKAFGEIPEAGEVETKTAEQAAEDGNTASGIDARKEQASAIEIYSALIQPMDDFFSTDQAQRLGFMEQFLLESQSKMLWNLIGNLTLIAEKGKAKAFTNRAEKEAARLSGDGAPEAEVEQTAEPEVQAEAQFNPFKRDKEPVEISKEDQISLKTDLKALLQTLRATKSMIGSYERNMTKVSVDPGLDGSALKEQLDQYLPMVQKSIAKIVERANEAFIKATELNAPKEEPEVSQPADATSPPPTPDAEPEITQEGMINAIFEAMQPALHEMSLMQEESRGETINRVDSVYKKMRLIYAPVGDGEDSEGLRGFMETGDRARTIQQAEKMLELATKEDFIKLFPGGRIGEGGMPATVNAATETMNREIKKLVLIMRDVVTLASKSVIPHSKLVEIVKSLSTISKSLYNSFGAKMMISGESLAQIETRLGEDESNKSLTDQETKPGIMDKLGTLTGKAGELAGKGLEKLKQMFSWMNEETRKLLLKLFGEESELIDGLSNSDLPEEQQGALIEEIIDSKSWFENLENNKQVAVGMFGNNLIRIRGINEVKFGPLKKLATEIETDNKKVLKAFRELEKPQQDVIEEVMRDDSDNIVQYLKTILRIVEKIGEEAAEELIALPELDKNRAKMKDPDDVDGEESPFPDIDSRDPKEPTPEMNDLLSRFATFIKRTGVLNEDIGKVFTMLGGKDSKKFGKSLGKSFKKEELEQLRDYFSTPEAVTAFLEMHFGDDEVYQYNKLPDKEKRLKALTKGLEDAMKAKEGEVPEPESLGSEDEEVFPSIDSDSGSKEFDEKEEYKNTVKTASNYLKTVKSGKVGEIVKPMLDSLIQKNKQSETKLYPQKVISMFAKVIMILMDQLESQGVLSEQSQSFGKFYAQQFKKDIKKTPSWKLPVPERDWIMSNIEDKDLMALISMIRKHHKEIKSNFESSGAKLDIEEALKPIIEKMLKEHYNH